MLVSLVVTLIVVGLLLYLIGLIPMDPTIAKLIRIVVIIFAVLYVIESLGLLGGGFHGWSGHLPGTAPCR